MRISEELLQTLNNREAVVPSGAELYCQGECCPKYFILLRGWIALSVLLDDGSCLIVDFALPGAFLGFQPTPGARMHHSAQCLTAVYLRAYPRRPFERLIEGNPRLAFDLCRQIGLDEARAHDHLINLGLRGARERIAHLLLELYVRLRRQLPAVHGEAVDLPVTQNHIGQAVGLSGVHVSRTLRTLREQKIARFANHRLEIMDPPALLRAAGIGHDVLDHRAIIGRSSRRGVTTSPLSGDCNSLLPPGWGPI